MTTVNASEIRDKISTVFLPFADAQMRRLTESRGRLVHYTTAESAFRILQSRMLWMRNARVMSDFSEIQYGHDRLREYFSSEGKRDALYAALHQCHANVGKEAIDRFDQWWSHIQFSTFITCLSEHDDTEDEHGRLSMWRAFGHHTARVALVLNIPGSYSADALNVTLSPVSYQTPEQLSLYLDSLVLNINKNVGWLKDIGRAMCVEIIYWTLVYAVVASKHPGFHEEREWRLVYSPVQRPSPHMMSGTEVIHGIPQIVQKIPLKNVPAANIAGIEPAEIINRVIVGPSPHAYAIYESLVKELALAGVKDADKKVVISWLPLRDLTA